MADVENQCAQAATTPIRIRWFQNPRSTFTAQTYSRKMFFFQLSTGKSLGSPQTWQPNFEAARNLIGERERDFS